MRPWIIFLLIDVSHHRWVLCWLISILLVKQILGLLLVGYLLSVGSKSLLVLHLCLLQILNVDVQVWIFASVEAHGLPVRILSAPRLILLILKPPTVLLVQRLLLSVVIERESELGILISVSLAYPI